MPNLYDILADAQHGDAMAELGQQFGLTPQQTQTAVAALLPAISVGLKQSTATPEGLGNLFALMAQRPDLFAMYDDPKAAFSRQGRDAGNAALAAMFGSPEASRAVADQAAADHRGKKFNSSKDSGSPFEFRLGAGEVIDGWDQGVAGMKVGGTRVLTVPPALGYGARGASGVIPPNATLVFEVELLDVH